MPLWAQVRDDIERRLRAAEFTQAFPTEMDLVDEYGVSRATVREALRRLRESGLIDAGRGRQPKVIESELAQPPDALSRLFASVESAGHTLRSIVRALDVRADDAVAARLGLEESTPLIYLERIWLVDEEPLALDRVWLQAKFAAPLLEADFTETSHYEELDRRCGVRLSGGSELVRAVVPTAIERALLEIPEPGAALVVERTGDRDGQPVEWRSVLIRADKFGLLLLSDSARPDAVAVFTRHDSVAATVTSHEIPAHATQRRGRSGRRVDARLACTPLHASGVESGLRSGCDFVAANRARFVQHRRRPCHPHGASAGLRDQRMNVRLQRTW